MTRGKSQAIIKFTKIYLLETTITEQNSRFVFTFKALTE